MSQSIWSEVRKQLHRQPELSSKEINTADTIAKILAPYKANKVTRGLGGTGVAFEFHAPDYYASSGITTLIRCELDALPIQEINDFEHRSAIDGVSHKCGHDGHMAIVASLAETLSITPPKAGRVILLFQPAEETGEGARSVVADDRYSNLAPDYAFALHNLPGQAAGEVFVKPGLFNYASAGLTIQLQGVESHAAHPEDGLSPASLMCDLIQQLQGLPGTIDGHNFVTIISANMGQGSFGTAPGYAEIKVTLRSDSNSAMELLASHAEQLVDSLSGQTDIQATTRWSDQFSTCSNTPLGAQLVEQACRSTGNQCTVIETPYRWSEDFGKLLESAKEGAMFTLGAGITSPQLHKPDYDFNDELIEQGRNLFIELIRLTNGLAE